MAGIFSLEYEWSRDVIREVYKIKRSINRTNLFSGAEILEQEGTFKVRGQEI